MRHTVGLYHGQMANKWKRYLINDGKKFRFSKSKSIWK